MISAKLQKIWEEKYVSAKFWEGRKMMEERNLTSKITSNGSVFLCETKINGSGK